MDRHASRLRLFAERLIASEAQGRKAGGIPRPAAFHVCEKLRPQLATLMGRGGFHALLTRAVVLAHAEVPWLRAVEVKVDGAIEPLFDVGKQVDAQETQRGNVALVAQLLTLLVAFIGAALTLRLVGEVWPKLPLDDLNFSPGDTK